MTAPLVDLARVEACRRRHEEARTSGFAGMAWRGFDAHEDRAFLLDCVTRLAEAVEKAESAADAGNELVGELVAAQEMWTRRFALAVGLPEDTTEDRVILAAVAEQRKALEDAADTLKAWSDWMREKGNGALATQLAVSEQRARAALPAPGDRDAG